MKTAIVKTFVVDITCPYCDEYVAEPSVGSHMWDVTEIKRGQVLECEHCNRQFRLPARVKSLELQEQ